MNAGLLMPGLEEVLFYLRGILQLIRHNPAGWRNLDISERGVSRSFWAIAWSLPGMLVSWLSWRSTYIEFGGVGDTGALFIFRMAVLDLTIWLLQIIFVAALLVYMKKAQHFKSMVVATNWLSVPFSIYSGTLSALQMLAPGGVVLWWILMNIGLAGAIYASYSIYRMMNGITTGPAISLAVTTLLTSLILTPILQTYLGVSL
ncbi:hypothetical protein [Rhizobium sp. L1K21]|uniref:hypothetical protein n=1 Tax=Rhizobium sp. L1K21 TaxID=2954933 RepID=UPI0020932FDF|nr:hypothetical protein [Rhizobium sp. L1K21]MCO6185563.1 hypothetical protein [Rhizobium sp. L1K21]